LIFLKKIVTLLIDEMVEETLYMRMVYEILKLSVTAIAALQATTTTTTFPIALIPDHSSAETFSEWKFWYLLYKAQTH